MKDPRAEERFDDLASQVHDWTESAVALDAGHFPNELLSDLRDLIEELKTFLEEETEFKRAEVLEMFVTPEMAEVMQRFPRVRKILESAWGSTLTDQIEEEAAPFDAGEDDEEEDY